MKLHKLIIGAGVAALGMALALADVEKSPAISGEALRPFEAQDYALAFDVLVGNGDLQRAFLIAQRAVDVVPQDRAWRRKLARISEWTQRSQIAADQWRTLFTQGDRAADTVAAVIRLAPLIQDPLLVIRAWEVQAKLKPLTDAQWEDVFDLYESAAEPALGSIFFEARFQSNKLPLLLEYAGRLAENSGDDERALRLYLQRASLQPFSLDFVLRAAVNLVRRNKLSEALALMMTHESEVPQESVEFWRLLSQVAWDSGASDSAQGAYTRFARLPQAVSADWSRLIVLVRRKHPAQAADLALQAYRRFGSIDQLLLGLGIYAELGDDTALGKALESLGAQADRIAEHDVQFLLLRAQHFQRKNKPELVWADLRRALRLSPNDKDVVLTSLWYMIDQNRTDVLPDFMRDHADLAAKETAFWQAYAVGNQVLERHREAVYWYAKILAGKLDDPLMLLNYADALERTHQTGTADRVRRHAWQQLRDKYPKAQLPLKLGQNPELLALARLTLMNQPADPALELVRKLVSQMRGTPVQEQDEQTRVLVLGWAIVKEQFANARAWMWRRYAQQSLAAAPLWGQSQTALQLKDTDTMTSLLERDSDALPVYNRYDTAHELGHVQQALDVAFKGMATQDDEPLYDRFRQHAPLQANYIQVGAQMEHQGALDRQALQFETRLVINSRLHAVMNWSRVQQAAGEPVLAAWSPESDRVTRAEVRWLGPHGVSSVALIRRDGVAALTGLRLSQSFQWGGRLNLDLGLDYRIESAASLPLRVAGYENTVYGSLNYALGKREYVRIAPRYTSYFTQFGDSLGTGQQLDLEVGYRIRTEYPDWRVRAYASTQRFSRDSGPDAQGAARRPPQPQGASDIGIPNPSSYFIPDTSSGWGGCLGMGDNIGGQSLQETYSRAWRPFMDICLNHNTLTGSGVNGTLGVAGSVTGEDHLRVQLQSSDGIAPGSAPTNSLAVRYRHYF
jgi:hypothetical protein